jgi:hypothetical protein
MPGNRESCTPAHTRSGQAGDYAERGPQEELIIAEPHLEQIDRKTA